MKQSFDPETLKRKDERVEVYIRHADQFFWLDQNTTPESRATIKTKLKRVERAAGELLTALSRLHSGDGFSHFAAAGEKLSKSVRLKSETDGLEESFRQFATESDDPALGNQRLMLRRLWTYLSAAKLQAQYSMVGLEPTRKIKGADRRRASLVSFLYLEWYLVFGELPNVTRDKEFHRVAAAIGQAQAPKITIGARTVAAIGAPTEAARRLRSRWAHLIRRADK
jgi:hypothetical protein